MNLSQFNRILMQTLLLPILGLSLVAGVLVWQVLRAQRTMEQVQLSHRTIATASEVQKLIIDEETGLRGYQITSDPTFLQPCREAEAPLRDAFARLGKNIQAEHEPQSDVEEITNAHRLWMETFVQPLIASIAAGGNTHDVQLNRIGKQRMDAIRDRIEDLLRNENRLREQKVAKWQVQERRTIETLVLLTVLAGIGIGIFTVSRLHRVSDAFQGTLDGLRRHAQATFESEERLRTTLTSVGDGVIVCSMDGKVELLNAAAQELTGWSLAEAKGRPLEEVFHIVNEQSRQLVETPVDKVKRLNKVVGLANHTVLIRKDGEELHIDDSGAPIRDRTGAMVGVVLVFRDVTEQKQAQQALMASEKLAVAGRLAATIAHEIHNPLDSVVNLMYLMRSEEDRAVLAKYIDMAQRELGRIGQISRALLGLYRESKMPVQVHLKEVTESVLVLLQRQIRQAKLNINVDIPDDVFVEGFPAELRQVFTNLIANATEACMPEGNITIRGRRQKGRTPGVVIDVVDNGTGIDQDALKHLFEPFFTTKGEQGTGLGLWVSRGIVEKHGGKMEITSHTGVVNHGTTIRVYLPERAVGPTSNGGDRATSDPIPAT